MCKTRIKFFTFCLFSKLIALDEGYPVSAGVLASSSLSLLSVSPNSAMCNPAVAENGLSVSYAMPYSMHDLSISSLSYQTKISSFSYGVGTKIIYQEDYNENLVYINAQLIQNNIVLGANFRYLRQEIEGYSSVNAVVADIGLRWQFYDFQSSWRINNICAEHYKYLELPISYQTEFAYYLSGAALFCVGIEKKEDLAYAAGLKFDIVPNFQLINSYMFESQQLAFGFNARLQRYRIDYGVKFHTYLSPSHSISINYYFK